MQEILNVESALKNSEVIKTLEYFRKKWRYLDPDDLESCFHTAIMKACDKHGNSTRKFTTTLSTYIKWEICRNKPSKDISFVYDDFETLQKRKIELATSHLLMYNLVMEWIEKYLNEKEKNIILLRVFQKLTWDEIATEIKCHKRSAKNYFFNGISKLRYISKTEGIKLCDELDCV